MHLKRRLRIAKFLNRNHTRCDSPPDPRYLGETALEDLLSTPEIRALAHSDGIEMNDVREVVADYRQRNGG